MPRFEVVKMRWKYMTIGFHQGITQEAVDRELNYQGSVGWELVAVVMADGRNMTAFFKKGG